MTFIIIHGGCYRSYSEYCRIAYRTERVIIYDSKVATFRIIKTII